MRISILLTTHNRELEAIHCLTNLLQQKTDDIEIILLDDDHIYSQSLNAFCNNNSINYIHTGIQKKGQYHWRMPGYALNIGAKLAQADYLVIGNCETLHTDLQCIEKMYASKDCVSTPAILGQLSTNNWESFRVLNNYFPWFWGFPKETFFEIGGFDEDFTGTAFDDADFSDRMLSILKFNVIDSKVIHLWNNDVGGGERWLHNKKLYETRKGIIKRNINKKWGIL